MGEIHCTPELLTAGATIAARKLMDSEGREEATSGILGDAAVVDLYDGPWGPALFWAALATCRPEGREAHLERCCAYLEPLLAHLEDWEDAEPPATLSLGGFNGFGAPVYSLAALSWILNEDRLIGRAESAARWITEARVTADRHFDVVDGVAGALLALLALDDLLEHRGLDPDSERRSTLLARATICGEHLLETRVTSKGLTSWPTPSGQRQTGFAHGAAGIRHALLRLFARTRDKRLLTAARQAAGFEIALHRPKRRAWLPFPEFDPDGRLMTAWCWGGPGIALSFAVESDGVPEPSFNSLLEAGLEATRLRKATRDDYLCCGNLGRALILADAAKGASGERRAGLTSEANRVVYGVLGRLKKRGDFGWRSNDEGGHSMMSFMKGIPGVGYAFLALSNRLPAVLRLGMARG